MDEPPGRTVRLDDERGLDLLYRVIRPLSPGPLTLDRAGVVAGASIIPAAARTLFVAPLPKTGRPEDFTGLVGHMEASLSPAGPEGKTTLRLSGNADLKLAGTPVQCVDGREPIVVSDRLKGHWPEWTRILTLLTGPECHPRLRLAWYDPKMGDYHNTTGHPTGFRPTGVVATLLATVLLAWAGREAYRLRTCRRWLNRDLAGLPRHRRLERLTKSGVPGPLAARIDHHWQLRETRPTRGPSSPAAKPGDALPWSICRQLAVTIDKRRRHRP
ncbi:MAG: hypothetical protein D6751_07225 [Deltaproteobacteria bacterium]|nr:MAG: hypothetical protein D6751_07225 [Deltaproteobacteria bacterium]